MEYLVEDVTSEKSHRSTGQASGTLSQCHPAGCTPGRNEDYLIKCARASKRRVRACQGWADGWVTYPNNPGMWAEADPHGNIRYYESGTSKKPLFMKTRGGTLIVYNNDGTIKERCTRSERHGGWIIYYDKSGKPKYQQDPNTGRIFPYDGKAGVEARSKDKSKDKNKSKTTCFDY
jgi:hypothetical protein